MGDKHKSDIQKPVKNTLLSGASHGFPFETFQGSSLLIPVSQDSPSVLNDDVNKLYNKNSIQSDHVTQLSEAVGMTTLTEGVSKQEESKSESQTVSQGYPGIFSSLFGGGSAKKQNSTQTQKTVLEQPSISASSTSRSSSPFVTIPNIQSFSPALQVPSTSSEGSHSETKPLGFTHSLDSPFSQVHNQSQQHNFETVPMNTNNPAEPLSSNNVALASTPATSGEPGQNEIQSFFSNSSSDIGFDDQPVTANLGFESFCSTLPKSTVAGSSLGKAQSTIELPVVGPPAPSSGSTPAFYNTSRLENSAPQFYQTRAVSADSFQTIQSLPFGAQPPLSAGLSSSSTAPPLSSGATSRSYRRDLHKRPVYAKVPGLTSKTTVSSSYLQPCENFSNTTSLSSSAIASPSGPATQTLSGSLSQPALSVAEPGIDLNSPVNNSFNPAGPLQNFFSSQSFPPISSTTQTVFDSFTPVTNSDTSASLVQSSQSFQDNITSSFNTAVFSNEDNKKLPVFPTVPSVAPAVPITPATGAKIISSPAVHPPIMSTREQSAVPTTSTTPDRGSSPVVLPASFNNLANLGTSGIIYRPAYHHWFFKIETKESKEIWQPFSMTDSLALEQAFNSDTLTPETLVPTDGGRHDVNITSRIRTSVYWEEEPKTVRRCSWFYKSTTESRLHPYDENTAYNLEEEYKKCVTTNSWHRKVDLPSGDYVIMYGPNSMALFQNVPQTPEGWEAEPDYSQPNQYRTKIVKRGVLDDFEIDEGESPYVDHLIFVVHGIGSVCDFRFRTIKEADKLKPVNKNVENDIIPGDLNSFMEDTPLENNIVGNVDLFRSKSLQLIKSHFRTSVEQGIANRVEILPVSWHSHLHGETTGVDKKLQTITLKSIPKLRNFTNDTLLDILFYTSPVYCQNIVQQVGNEVNTLYAKFKARNPNFNGGVSLVGHSLGSLILFDILLHQKPPSPHMGFIREEAKANVVDQSVTTIVSPDKKRRSLSRNVSYVIGTAGTGQPFIEYPQLSFQPLTFFALGSPIGMFVTVRGIDSLGLDFCLPTCSRFFNVFHPSDPVAYRIEALINPELAEKRPVLIPHHKGRKRMHLELKETMARVGADLKQRLVDSVRSTWNTVYQLTMFGRADDGLEQEVDKVIEKQLERQRTESVGNCINDCDESDVNAGLLNQGRRIDYVLQEAPLESVNEYVSAIRSHVIYWNSEDTMLLILKEIYSCIGVSPDSQLSGISGMQEEMTTPSPTHIDPSNEPSTSSSYRSVPPAFGFK